MSIGIHRRAIKGCMFVAKHGRRRYCTAAAETKVDAPTPDYPPISDLSFRARKLRKEGEWHDKIKSLKTVEEKLFELNMPRYYGWKSVILEEKRVRYNTLDFARSITRTHVARDFALPNYYNDSITSGELEDAIEKISCPIRDTVIFENCNYREEARRKEKTLADGTGESLTTVAKSIVGGINRILLSNLSEKYPHLSQVQVERDPRVEAFWFAGGMNPPLCVRRSREGLPWYKEYIDDPVDRSIQYFGSPILHLRHESPLGEMPSLTESERSALSVPEFKLDPRTVGYAMKRKAATNIPGFWPGDPCEFGLISYHGVSDFVERPKGRDDDDIEEALTVQAILASYGWLLGQACYQGFSTFNDITYPFVTQTIITDGQWWTFCTYQLNTTLVHGEHARQNPKKNLCWITKPAKLYDTVDTENRKMDGLNAEVLRNLVKFYANAPRARPPGIEAKPYLGASVKSIADIPEDERRVWLEKHYKHLVSQRSRHRRIPEIYHWQKIYMIDNKTRPMEKRRDFWQFGINPFKRRLDDHTPQYIPRKQRKDPSKRKIGRWEKTYYP